MTGATEVSSDAIGLEADARMERMDRVAVLYAEITAATREFLRALAECDRHRDWADAGFGSCADWLAWRIGVSKNTANEKVRTALALESLPLISEAMAHGEISFSKVRAVTRVATPETEAELLGYARTSRPRASSGSCGAGRSSTARTSSARMVFVTDCAASRSSLTARACTSCGV